MPPERKLEILFKAIDQVSAPADQISKRLMKVGEEMKKLGKTFTVAGAAISAGIGVGVKAAMDFEKQMAFVATMLDKHTEKYLPAMSKAVEEMAVTYGESTRTLTKGLYDVLSAGIEAEKATQVLEVAVRAAAAGMTDTAISADVLTTIIKSYGLESSKAGDVADWLFAIVKRGKTTFDELAPSLGRVTALAAEAGIPMEELGAMLMSLTRAGIRTDEAITSLRGIIAAMVAPTEEAEKTLAEFAGGMTFAELRQKGLFEAVKLLSGATEEQQAAMFGNIRALSGLAVVLGDVAGFQADLAAMTERTGAMQEAFQKTTETAEFQLRRFKEAVMALWRSFSENLLPAVSWILEQFSSFLDIIRDIPAPIKTVVSVIAALTGGFTLLSGILLTVGGHLATITAKMKATTLGAKVLAAANMKVGGSFSAMLGPIGLVTAAIGVGLVVALRKYEERLKKVDEAHTRFADVTKRINKAVREGNIDKEKAAEILKKVAEQEAIISGRVEGNIKLAKKAKEALVSRLEKMLEAAEKEAKAEEKRAKREEELRKEREKREKEARELRMKGEEELRDRIFELTASEFEKKAKAIEEEKERYEKLGVDKTLIEKWYNEEVIKLSDEMREAEEEKEEEAVEKARERLEKRLEHMREFHGKDLEDLIAHLRERAEAEDISIAERKAALDVLAEYERERRIASREEWAKHSKEIAGYFSTALQSMMRGEKTFEEATKEMWKSIHSMVLRIISDIIAEETRKAILSIFFAKKSAAAKAVEAHAGIPFIGLALASAAAMAMVSLITRVAALERGGVVRRPTLALLGEKGPEAVVPLGKSFSNVRIENVIIQFPEVTTFRDWIEADPELIKEVTERKLLQAFETLAIEGRMKEVIP